MIITRGIKDVVVPREHLAGLIAVALEKAVLKQKSYHLIESEPGMYRVISGYCPWSEKVRAYIEPTGKVSVSDYAKQRFGFELP